MMTQDNMINNSSQIEDIDEQIRLLKKERDSLVEKIKKKEKQNKESEEDYERTLIAKRQLEDMISESVAYFKKNLYDKDSRVKILKRSFENAKKVLYGSKMQEIGDDLQQGLKEIADILEQNDSSIKTAQDRIRVIDEKILKLKQERRALNV